jgi:hypothetical protein
MNPPDTHRGRSPELCFDLAHPGQAIDGREMVRIESVPEAEHEDDDGE